MKDFWNKYIREPIAKWLARLRGKITPTAPAPSTPQDDPGVAPGPSAPPSDNPQQNGYGDELDPAVLQWSFGGFNGARASLDTPRIGALRMGRNLAYAWRVNDLSAWGLSYTDAGALACLFVERRDGSWGGGKFDWISSSRLTRDFANIVTGYRGWTLEDVDNPCRAAFVIVDSAGRRRTNIITCTWTR